MVKELKSLVTACMKSFTIMVALLYVGHNTTAQTIRIDKYGLFINEVNTSTWYDKTEKKLHIGWKYTLFKDLLGEPNRTYCCGITHTYDSLGIVIYEGIGNMTGNDHVKELQIFLSADSREHEVASNISVRVVHLDKGASSNDSLMQNGSAGNQNPDPIKVFQGTISIGDQTLVSNITVSELSKLLRGWKRIDSYQQNTYRYSNGKTYIFFSFNSTENELLQISLGSERKSYWD